MGNSFESSLNTSMPGQLAPNNGYWSNIAAESQRQQPQVNANARPWLPSYPSSERLDSQQVRAEAPPTNQPLKNPLEVLAAAEASLAQRGMTTQTKELYTQAIAAADAAYNPADLKVLQTLSDVLKTGKKVDGTALTGPERFQGHQILDAELQSAQLGVQVRLIYSTMLQSTGQFATAQNVLKDSIRVADQLPQDLIKKQSQLLQTDLTNSSLTREQQILLGEMVKVNEGDKSLKTPGYAYLPTLARLATAEYYVSAEPRPDKKTPNGVLKPELALAMLESAKTSYQQNSNADITKKGTDSSYDRISDMAHMTLPENLKKLKSDADGAWSNPLVDLAVGAAVFAIASRFHLSPSLIKAGLATTEGLTLGGKALATAAMVGGATVGRHYGRELLTGSSETWLDSTIHGTAGLAEIGLVIGTRSKLSSVMFRGANAESALLRVAEVKGTEGALTSGALKDLYSANRWAMPKALSALDSSAVIVKDGALVNSIDLGLNAAKSAELTRAALTGPSGNIMVRSAKFAWNLPGSLANSVGAVVNPTALDLATATAKQIAARGNITGYLSAFAGAEGYRAITSLDRPHDPISGERISYAASFANNMLSPEPFIDGLVTMPFLKPGIMPRNFYSESAWASARNVFSHLGPSGALANSENSLTRAAVATIPIGLGTAQVLQGINAKITGKAPAFAIQDLIDQENGH